jgi:hypothetical protein
MKKLLIATLLSACAFSPASAAMMACTGENMAKSAGMMATGPTPANKEMAMANMDMSNGKMKSACMHYMKAQKMSMMK